MKRYLLEISDQPLKEYLWPDVSTALGKKTALYEGALVSLGLAIIYGIITLQYYFNGAPLPEGAGDILANAEEMTGNSLFDPELYTSLKILFSSIAALTGLYYIRSIGLKKSKLSIIFLVIWTLLEVLSSGLSIMLPVYALLFLGALNSYRTIR